MERPELCPQEVYDVMDTCWQSVAQSRPSFDFLNTFLHDFESWQRPRQGCCCFPPLLSLLACFRGRRQQHRPRNTTPLLHPLPIDGSWVSHWCIICTILRVLSLDKVGLPTTMAVLRFTCLYALEYATISTNAPWISAVVKLCVSCTIKDPLIVEHGVMVYVLMRWFVNTLVATPGGHSTLNTVLLDLSHLTDGLVGVGEPWPWVRSLQAEWVDLQWSQVQWMECLFCLWKGGYTIVLLSSYLAERFNQKTLLFRLHRLYVLSWQFEHLC